MNHSKALLGWMDDKDTLKGINIIQRLYKVHRLYASALEQSQNEVKSMTDQVDHCHTWYKCDFKPHLQKMGNKLVAHISCGLSI